MHNIAASPVRRVSPNPDGCRNSGWEYLEVGCLPNVRDSHCKRVLVLPRKAIGKLLPG